MQKNTMGVSFTIIFIAFAWSFSLVQAHTGDPCPHSRPDHPHCTQGGSGGSSFVMLDGNLNLIGPVVNGLGTFIGDENRVAVLVQVQDSSATTRNTLLPIGGGNPTGVDIDFLPRGPVWFEVADCPEDDPQNPPFLAPNFLIPGAISAGQVIPGPNGERRLFVATGGGFQPITALSRLEFDGTCVNGQFNFPFAVEAEIITNDLHNMFPLPYTLAIQ